MNNPILKVCDLNYAYNSDKQTLKNINISIYDNEKIAVLGANGAGKSTFFLNLNGVIYPDTGNIFLKGKKINKKNLNELRKNVGIVFQEADNQIIASTVMAEVSFGPINLKLPKNEVIERVDRALKYMNISEFKNRPPHYLSGGEKKRVSIADIIAMNPEIIIFDEPTASLDPINIDMLQDVLQKLYSENKTILISTHDVDFAYRWANRIIVFSDGEIIADDTPNAIFDNKDILKRANLKPPTILEVYNILSSKNLIKNKNIIPKTTNELIDIL